MKKYGYSLVIFFCLGSLLWSQAAKTELFDARKAQQELEIMKGILATTLSFVAQEIQKPAAASTRPEGRLVYSYGQSMMRPSAFYLYGQGAVFVISSSSLRLPGLVSGNYVRAAADFELASEQSRRQLEAASREIAVLAEQMDRRGAEARRIAPPAAPPQAAKPPSPPATPAPPTPPQVSQEELRKKLAEAQEKVKKVREENEANRAKFMEALAQIKIYLIEALANHGDSLTTVKANEYINVVIMTGDLSGRFNWEEGGRGADQEVISVQKSWISDYKAGRLTLEAFKQKTLQYSE